MSVGHVTERAELYMTAQIGTVDVIPSAKLVLAKAGSGNPECHWIPEHAPYLMRG
jgi:hypothetical protein